MPQFLAISCALLVALSGCNPYGCVYRTRFVSTTGNVTGASGTLAVTYVNMRDYSEGQPVPTSVIWNISAEQLTSPAKTLTLRDANDLNAVALTLTMSHTSSVSMVATSSADIAPADRNRYFELLSSGRGRVFLELENGTMITVPLAVATLENWHRPNCS